LNNYRECHAVPKAQKGEVIAVPIFSCEKKGGSENEREQVEEARALTLKVSDYSSLNDEREGRENGRGDLPDETENVPFGGRRKGNTANAESNRARR